MEPNFDSMRNGALDFVSTRNAPFQKDGSMETPQSAVVFTLLYIMWGAITVVLVVLLGYRATLLCGDDRKFVDANEQDYLQHEKALIARSSLLTGEIIVLSVLSGVLLLTCAGSSIYHGLMSF
jgi:hypothetical protein